MIAAELLFVKHQAMIYGYTTGVSSARMLMRECSALIVDQYQIPTRQGMIGRLLADSTAWSDLFVGSAPRFRQRKKALNQVAWLAFDISASYSGKVW
jgi:hypothetical protein